jgi:two-component system chemotaxis response regulator CheB
MQEGSLLRFRCHIGHAYTAEALLVDQNEEVELALSHALRALEDRADLSKRLALRAKDKKQKHNQALYESQVREAETHAAKLRQTLLALRPNERG